MNDEFEQRLARHSLRAAPPEVTAELIAALRSQRADTRVQASVPRTPRDSGDSGLANSGTAVGQCVGDALLEHFGFTDPLRPFDPTEPRAGG